MPLDVKTTTLLLLDLFLQKREARVTLQHSFINPVRLRRRHLLSMPPDLILVRLRVGPRHRGWNWRRGRRGLVRDPGQGLVRLVLSMQVAREHLGLQHSPAPAELLKDQLEGLVRRDLDRPTGRGLALHVDLGHVVLEELLEEQRRCQRGYAS